jgi:serine protease Do/serine protease DegQ
VHAFARSVTAVALLPISLSYLAASEGPDEAAASRVRASMASVRGGKFYGSGILWDARAGLVLTALHVVEEMPEIVVSLPGVEEQYAEIVDRDRSLDLALLRVEDPSTTAPLAERGALLFGSTTELSRGQPAWLLGCPERRCGTMVRGSVGRPSREFAGSRYLELAVEVEPGMSGGPVVDARGALVGIVDLTFNKKRSVTFAIPIERAWARFSRSPARSGSGSGG